MGHTLMARFRWVCGGVGIFRRVVCLGCVFVCDGLFDVDFFFESVACLGFCVMYFFELCSSMVIEVNLWCEKLMDVIVFCWFKTILMVTLFVFFFLSYFL